MIKLCLLTFKCRTLQWFKHTLPLACALDLAALENIPGLSFRNVYQSQTGVMKLLSVLILIPRCLQRISAPSHSHDMKSNWLVIKAFILDKHLHVFTGLNMLKKKTRLLKYQFNILKNVPMVILCRALSGFDNHSLTKRLEAGGTSQPGSVQQLSLTHYILF